MLRDIFMVFGILGFFFNLCLYIFKNVFINFFLCVLIYFKEYRIWNWKNLDLNLEVLYYNGEWFWRILFKFWVLFKMRIIDYIYYIELFRDLNKIIF